jgi:hypothetical protein
MIDQEQQNRRTSQMKLRGREKEVINYEKHVIHSSTGNNIGDYFVKMIIAKKLHK